MPVIDIDVIVTEVDVNVNRPSRRLRTDQQEASVAKAAPDEREILEDPRARQRAQTRARILDAAKLEFEQKGYVAVRVSDIVERAGVSHGLFYNYFDSKQDIFRELARGLEQELIDSREPMADPNSRKTLQERMQEAISINFERYRRDASLISLVEEVSRHDPEVDRARRALGDKETQRLTNQIRQMQRLGLADKRLDPVVASIAVGAMGWRFAERWFVRGELACDFEEGVAQFTRLVLNALGTDERAAASRAPLAVD